MNVRLWFIRDSDSGKARLYSRVPSSRHPTKDDEIWVPVSVFEGGRSIMPAKEGEKWAEHTVRIADWFAEKNGL